MVRITTLMDNKPSEHKALISKHGLSLLVETPSGNILFDCGSDQDIIHNAKLLGIDITQIDNFAGSHGHYDHIGGFLDLLDNGYKGRFYSGKGFFDRKLAVDQGKYTYLGVHFNKDTLQNNSINYTECKDILEIFKDCYVITNFPRIYSFEEPPARFVKEIDGEIQRDLFEDEICLVIKTEKGLVVVVGCSHPGILNMLCYVYEKFNQPIYAVLGGTHLVEADDERINITLDKLTEMGIKFIGLSHCSGDRVQDIMESRNMKNCHMTIGSVVLF